MSYQETWKIQISKRWGQQEMHLCTFPIEMTQMCHILTFPGPPCRPGQIFLVQNGLYMCPTYSTTCFMSNSHLWGYFWPSEVRFRGILALNLTSKGLKYPPEVRVRHETCTTICGTHVQAILDQKNLTGSAGGAREGQNMAHLGHFNGKCAKMHYFDLP